MTKHLDERCLAAQVRRIHRVVVGSYDDALRSLGITVGQLDMLVTLVELGDEGTPAALGRALLMDRSTVSRNLRRLEGQGLVRLSRRRRRVVELTAKGRRVLDRAYDPWSRTQQQIKEQIGSDGVHALDRLVERLGKES